MTMFLYGMASGIGASGLLAGHLWQLERRRRGLSLTRRWR